MMMLTNWLSILSIRVISMFVNVIENFIQNSHKYHFGNRLNFWLCYNHVFGGAVFSAIRVGE